MSSKRKIYRNEAIHELHDYAYQVFEEKGVQNAVKVRRIMQITKDLSVNDFSDISILDLGCAEGVYAIEAGIRGANVLAVDGRNYRLDWGKTIAEKLNLTNVKFLQEDVRSLTKEKFGRFDVVVFLGLLYHLDEPDLFNVLSTVYDMCNDFVIIDTQVSPQSVLSVSYKGNEYYGKKSRKHGDNDPPHVIQARVASSMDNVFSFKITKESLLRLLYDIGFTTVFECFIPPEPLKDRKRITLAAIKGSKVKISSYPWINELSEEKIEKLMAKAGPWKNPWTIPIQLADENYLKRKVNNIIRRFIRKLGYDIVRLG
jgi:SAM-dependent methyltransferase